MHGHDVNLAGYSRHFDAPFYLAATRHFRRLRSYMPCSNAVKIHVLDRACDCTLQLFCFN